MTARYALRSAIVGEPMTSGGTIMANPFVHVELTTPDPDKAKSFYGDLFGWKLNDVEMRPGMVYTLIDVGDGTGGGIMKSPAPDVPTAWLPYVFVDDVRAATDKATGLGATLCHDVTEVPNAGWFSIIQDPTGAAIGLWQPKSR